MAEPTVRHPYRDRRTRYDGLRTAAGYDDTRIHALREAGVVF